VSHLYFDISGVAGLGEWEQKRDQIASSIRALGVQRILCGSDGAWMGFTPKKPSLHIVSCPITAREFAVIDSNSLPKLPWREGNGELEKSKNQ
jgi:hypothetical protein